MGLSDRSWHSELRFGAGWHVQACVSSHAVTAGAGDDVLAGANTSVDRSVYIDLTGARC